MLSAGLALCRRHRLRRGGLPRRTRRQAAALDRRHGGRGGIRSGAPGARAPLRRRRVDAGRCRVGCAGRRVRRGRDRAAVRVPGDRADEHPVAAHRRRLGDRTDAVGAARERRDPVADRLRRAGRRARRRRARRLHPRREGRATERARARHGGRRGPRDRRVPHRDRPDERRERTRAPRHEPGDEHGDHGDHRRQRSSSGAARRAPRGDRCWTCRAPRRGDPDAATPISSTRRASSRRRALRHRRNAGVAGSRSSAESWMPRRTRSCCWRCGSAICRSSRR